MTSPTQRQLSHDDVVVLARTAFGAHAEVRATQRLTGGTFGAVWRVELAEGRRVVLKAGPAAGARLLTYEAGILAAEAEYLQLVESGAPDVPMARLLHAGDEWLFMSLLPGMPLATMPADADTSAVRRAAGAAVARIHQIVGPVYGYTGARPHGATWFDAFSAMIAALLDDARAWRVDLPVSSTVVRSVVSAHAATLAAVTRPSLLHFDLWDGNVLAIAGADGRAELAGLVDGERYLYGDPLVDFVSPALFGDIFADPDHPFVHGYRSVTPLHVDDQVRRRLWLYQLHLYLIMMVEFPSRGMSPERQTQRWQRLGQLVRELVDRLTV